MPIKQSEIAPSWQTAYWQHYCQLRIAAATAELATKLYFKHLDSKPYDEAERIMAADRYNREANEAFDNYRIPKPIENRKQFEVICCECRHFLVEVARFRNRLPDYPDVARAWNKSTYAEIIEIKQPLLHQLEQHMKWIDAARDFAPQMLLRELLSINSEIPDGRLVSFSENTTDDFGKAIDTLLLLSSFEIPPSDNPASKPKPDGFDANDIFWYGGKPHPAIKGKNLAMLKCVFPGPSTEHAIVGEAVWEDEFASPKKIRTQVDRLNKFLKKNGIPLSFSNNSSCVTINN